MPVEDLDALTTRLLAVVDRRLADDLPPEKRARLLAAQARLTAPKERPELQPKSITSKRFPSLAVEVHGDDYEFRFNGHSIECWRITAGGAAKTDCHDRLDFPYAVAVHVRDWIAAEQARKAKAAVAAAAQVDAQRKASDSQDSGDEARDQERIAS